MAFVLDASIAITWAMSDESDPLAELALRRIEIESTVVPAIWWYEVRNALLVNERRNRITKEDFDRFLDNLADFEIEVRPPEHSQIALQLARQHKLSIYDSAYLALALEQNIPLATLDVALQSAARSMDVPLLSDIPPEAS